VPGTAEFLLEGGLNADAERQELGEPLLLRAASWDALRGTLDTDQVWLVGFYSIAFTASSIVRRAYGKASSRMTVGD